MRNPRHSISLAFLAVTVTATAEIVSADRRVDWSQSGVENGIPVVTQIFATVTASIPGTNLVAAGNGIADDYQALQTAINLCPSNQVVFLPAGNYRLTNCLDFYARHGVVVRGAGMGQTILTYPNSLSYGVRFIEGPWWTARNTLVSGGARGSTNITVTTGEGSDYKVGGHCFVDQYSDTNWVNVYGLEGPGDSANRDYNHAVGQWCEIKGVTGDTLNVWPPLAWDFTNSTLVPEVFTEVNGSDYKTMILRAGLESLSLYNTSSNVSTMIHMTHAANCWVKSVEVFKPKTTAINLLHCFRTTIHGCFIHDSSAATPGSGAAYSINVNLKSTFCRIENNLSSNMLFCAILEYGPVGNVIAYNLETNQVYYDSEWTVGAFASHAVHPSFNLFEGNIGGMFIADFIHGSSSHNTLLRNHFKGREVGTIYQHRAVELDAWNRYYNVLGNVLADEGWAVTNRWQAVGESDSEALQPVVWRLGYNSNASGTGSHDTNVLSTLIRHGNYDYVTNAVQWAADIVDHDIPDSYYLTTAPDWFTGYTWPPIDSESVRVGPIPAMGLMQAPSQSHIYGTVNAGTIIVRGTP